jgi:Ala-tRNA(Pro) deacylase
VYDKAAVLAYLDGKNVSYDLIEHEPMYTIGQMEEAGLTAGIDVCKNLFLRDYKGKNHYLISFLCHKKMDLKEISQKLVSTRLSFASAQRLEQYLKLTQGAVSPFGLLNDSARTVEAVFDKALLGRTKTAFHPNDNSATVIIHFDDLLNIIQSLGNRITFIDIA